VSSSKGICDKFYEEEIKRLDGYTFDWVLAIDKISEPFWFLPRISGSVVVDCELV
jgi:hypothetical protein